MASGLRRRISSAHAIACWSGLCLLLALFSLVIPATPASAGLSHAPVELISSPVDGHSDCDHRSAGMTGHCHTTSSCFAQAQVAATVSPDLRASSHPLAVLQDDVTSRSLQPNPRPPKRSIQA